MLRPVIGTLEKSISAEQSPTNSEMENKTNYNVLHSLYIKTKILVSIHNPCCLEIKLNISLLFEN